MIVRSLARGGCAVVLALSWLVAAGLPAGAAVTRTWVDKPKPDAVISKAVPLVIGVEWRQTFPRERLEEVRTRLIASDGGIVGCDDATVPDCGVLHLKEASRTQLENGSFEVLFAGEIDPHNLAWAGGAVAPNGRYQLHYQSETSFPGGPGSEERERTQGDWQFHLLTLDAPPPPQGAPVARVTNSKKKEITVAWPTNGAPDLTSYTVERRRGSGDWKVAARGIAAGTTRHVERVGKLGAYRYRVVAAREAASPEADPHTTRSKPSATLKVESLEEKYGFPDQRADTGPGNDSPVISSGSAPTTGGNTAEGPRFAAPADANTTFKGPLDYGVAPREVTERVPVDIAQGGSGSDSSLTVVDSALDRERVLPPLAGGLILIVSAAHVLRYLNE